MINSHTGLWIAFAACISIIMIIDLGIIRRKSNIPSFKKALALTCLWILFAILFNLGIYYYQGTQAGTQFLTSYIIEQSLSVDNLFVFLLIFTEFAVPSQYQHRVLFYGVIGAIIMRGIFIYTGLALFKQYYWVMFIFAAFLIFTGLKMLVTPTKKPDIANNRVVRYLKQHFRITPEYHQNQFWLFINKQLWLTPLFLVLILIEISDLIFAVDSIPAVIAITQDPFIVYTSNIFAILGLRSLYFVLSSMADRFYYLKTGLSFILIFVGCKMAITHYYNIPIFISLSVILCILIIAIIASLRKSSPPLK